ncbi:MAG: hypothetical protein ACKVJU_03165 [Verrucomicrobiales bacterium]
MEKFGTHLTRAFKWHWNLLALGAGVAVAFLSGHPDIFLPVILAVEMGYLGFLGTNQRFQNVLRGNEIIEEQKEAQASAVTEKQRQLAEYLKFLSPEDRARFDAIRERSRAMTELQKTMRTDTSDVGDAGFKTQSLDKMIWLFLKLLHHKEGLGKFLDNTSESGLELKINDTTQAISEGRESGSSDRLIDSLTDKLATLESRLTNYREADENFKILEAELDKTEQKINHICEVGMTSRDSSNLSSQIDGVADSVRLSEQALHGLDLGNIFEDTSAPPPLISEDFMEME